MGEELTHPLCYMQPHSMVRRYRICEFLWAWRSLQRIFAVIRNSNPRKESLCRERCCHFTPRKKHTKNKEQRLSELCHHLHRWHFLCRTLFSWPWIKSSVSNMPGSITVVNAGILLSILKGRSPLEMVVSIGNVSQSRREKEIWLQKGGPLGRPTLMWNYVRMGKNDFQEIFAHPLKEI